VGSSRPEDVSSAPANALSKLQAVTDAALGRLALEELLDELLERVRDALEADTCAVLMLDDTGTELVARAAKGLEEEVERGLRIPVGKGFAGHVASSGRPVVIEDLNQAEVLNPLLREKGVKSLLGVPLVVGGRTLGVLHVGTLTPRAFPTEDIELLQIVAGRVALAIDRAIAHDEIVRLGELQREFIALAAHELRAPATAVYGLAATLHDRRGQLDDATVVHLEETLYQQSQRLRRLVDQLLDLSRLDAQTVEIRRKPLALGPHLEKVVQEVAPERSHEVTVQVPAKLQPALDATAVDHIVSNLLTNALRYGEAPVTISAEQRDRHLRITVEDNGDGISAEFVPELFERFRRSQLSRETAPGTGLGLAIARSYARAHGGDLVYTPSPSKGARFEVILPTNG
jgi:signal transduction histidine kinase